MKNRFLVALLGLLTSAVVPFQASAQVPGALANAKATGIITLGVRSNSGALSYAQGGGKFGGFHVDICLRIVEDAEKLLGRKLEVKYLPVNLQTRIPELNSGRADLICGSATNSLTRQKEAAFLNTVFVEEGRVVVKVSSGITNIVQLNGKTVASTTGTTAVAHLKRHERGMGVRFKELNGADHDESFALLASGKADAFLMDRGILAAHVASSPNPAEYRMLDEQLSIEPIGIMVRRDDPSIKKLGDETIARLVASGEIAKLYDKWFLKPIPPRGVVVGLPLSAATKAAWANLNDKPMEHYKR
ncbi:amino acid ABC transporter substrate-binding protein [Ramlibacter sp.]|uniref:amino acid ABC transporter substrate-binding protein n=1 Tax=Ramlibacter sp. TaxID=1917967 RepID=UPI0035AFFF82